MSESQEINEIKRVYARLETLYHTYFHFAKKSKHSTDIYGGSVHKTRRKSRSGKKIYF